MGHRLRRVVQQFVVKEKAGVTKLALAVGKHQTTVQRWIDAGRIPDAHDRYLVALACGYGEAEAVDLATEAPAMDAMESA